MIHLSPLQLNSAVGVAWTVLVTWLSLVIAGCMWPVLHVWPGLAIASMNRHAGNEMGMFQCCSGMRI